MDTTMTTAAKLTVISLGWGLQSWVLAAMAALGELPAVDFAIHSDTTWERQATYEFARKMTPWLQARGVRVVTVSDPATRGMINKEWAGTFIPAYTLSPAGLAELKNGQLRRQCTGRWKVQPMRQFINQALSEHSLRKTPGVVEQWLGITLDEWHRAKDSDVKYIRHRFPLLEKRMSRMDCITWLRSHDLPIPGKSACTFCPYHTNTYWQQMKRENGPDWQQAVEVDARIRDERPPYPLYVHSARKPLAQAVVIPEDNGLTQPSLLELLETDDYDAQCDSGHCFL